MNRAHDDLAKVLEEPRYIDDGGFTDGVVRALPPRRSASVVRYVVVPAFAAAGCAASCAHAQAWGHVFARAATQMQTHGHGGVAAILAVAAMAAMVGAGAAAAAMGD